MKESFILYNSFYEPIKTLKNEQLGKLLRAIFNYTINGEITQEEDILIAFMFIKNEIDKNNEKWQEEKRKRSEAGKKGMASRWNKSDNNVIDSYNKYNNVINDITNITDNVYVDDNVNVNDNVIKENIKRKVFEKPTIEEIQNYCNERNNGINAEAFHDFYESKNWYVGKNKMKDWKASVRTWERRSEISKPKVQNNVIDPKWLDKEIEEERATDEEIKELEERLRRK